MIMMSSVSEVGFFYCCSRFQSLTEFSRSRLLLVSPLSASLEMVQSLSSVGALFPSLIVQRALEQLTTAPLPGSSLPKLLAFLLVLTFDSTALKCEF